MTTFDEYQKRAALTAVYPHRGEMAGLTYCTLGLAGEAGELANKVKKVLRDSGGVLSPETMVALVAELGDVLWYCAELAANLGLPLSAVAERNLAKLQARRVAGTVHGSGDER